MGRWEPIFWIIGGGLGVFVLLLLLEMLKGGSKKNPPLRRDKPTEG